MTAAPKLRSATVAMLVGLLSACGGGGDDAPPAQPPTQPPTPAIAQINGTNYLDAYAVTYIGVLRIEFLAYIIDSAFEVVIDVDDIPGTYQCVAGGSLTLVKNGASRTITANNCSDGSNVFISGSVSSPNATASQFGNLVLLDAGDFVLSNAVYRRVGDSVTETANGNIRVQRRADLSFAGSGQFSVLRNGRADQYANVSVTTVPATSANGPIELTSGSMSLSSPRFTAQPLAVAGSDAAQNISVRAPDGSRVVTTDVSSGTTDAFKFDVFAANASSPTVTQTLALNDPLWQAAVQRALQ
jgi:archaellum component FlaG (FlaF/FlaG flagellin family)